MKQEECTLKALVIDGGGRGHALCRTLALSPQVEKIYCAPGNPGTAMEPKCENVPIKVDKLEDLALFALDNKIDLTVVGPEAPLVKGVVDIWPQNLRIFGPTAAQAMLEGSKVYAKTLMRGLRIPTARFEVCDTFSKARRAIIGFPHGRCVIKADGLCGGKGAFPCQNREEAEAAAYAMLMEDSLGEAGRTIIIEDYLDGREASLMVLVSTAGELIPLEVAQDHKRLLDNDEGPNTGGMGAYSPVESFTPDMVQETLERIVQPIVHATGFRGVFYSGLMVNKNEISVLEINVRFGDPELQAVLPRLKTDLFELLYNGAIGNFGRKELDWSPEACVCVVLAAKGYPEKPIIGAKIEGLDILRQKYPSIIPFHAGTKVDGNGNIIVAGGRVLGITAMARTKGLATGLAYQGIAELFWMPSVQFRTDIAK